MRRNQLRFAKNLLYRLKRRYGSPGVLYTAISISDDIETGTTVYVKQKYPIRRIIALPSTMLRELNIAGGRKTDKDFENSEIDLTTRQFVIDKEDLPTGYEIKSEDYLIIKDQDNRRDGPGKRYNIQKSQELEENIGVLITARYVAGGQRNEIFDLTIKEILILQETLVIVP